MHKLFRVLFVLYVLFLAACVQLILDRSDAGGPYHFNAAFGSIGAGLPWTLVVFVIHPPGAGPRFLYVLATLGALFNLGLLAHWAGWLRLRRSP